MRRALGAAVLALVLTPAAAPAMMQRGKWDTRVFAHVPSPGFPARTYVDPHDRVWEGTYVNPNGDTLPSRVYEFGPDGGIVSNYSVAGQRLDQPHGVQVATSDAQGRLILLDRTPSRVIVLDTTNGRQTTYAEFRDLHPCGTPKAAPNECSPTLGDDPPFADYAAWLPDGSLLVTDYAQAVIWRVPPHGGTPTVWLADKRLAGTGFGTAGIWLMAGGRRLLVSQATTSLDLSNGNPTTGRLYAIDVKPDETPGAMTQLWESLPTDLPDGFAVSAAGNVYLANVGLSSQLVEIGPDGKELDRFPKTFGTGENGSPVPFDSPSGLMFLGTSIIVANQSALFGNTANQALLDVETQETGAPEIIPPGAGPVDVTFPPTSAPLTARRVRTRGRVVTLRLSHLLSLTRIDVVLTRAGATIATGTARGRTLRVIVRRGRRLRGAVTIRAVRGTRLAYVTIR